MGRLRIYQTDAERQRAFRERRSQELSILRQQTTRPPRHLRHEHDVYLTPVEFVRSGLARVTVRPSRILDVDARPGGMGR